MDTQKLAALKKIGNEWQKGNMHRIYFNSLGTLYGVTTERYYSGNIQNAWLNGDKISNSEARRILDRLTWAKIWFDVANGEFHGKNVEHRDFEIIVAAIETKAAKLMAEVA